MIRLLLKIIERVIPLFVPDAAPLILKGSFFVKTAANEDPLIFPRLSLFLPRNTR